MDSPPRSRRRLTSRPRCAALAIALLGVLPAVMLSVPTTAHAATKNANFDGDWTVDGARLVVTDEDVATGEFGGSLKGPDSTLDIVSGKVTGNAYTFTVEIADTVVGVNGAQFTYGGTFSGNTMTITETAIHAWKNGHPVSASSTDPGPFTGTREGSATSTDVACKEQNSPVGTFSCTATVTTTDANADAPSGTVTFSVPKGTFSDGSCDVKDDSDDSSSASCSDVYTPTATANEADETVTATYTSDAGLGTSDGSTTIDAVVISATDKTVDTYLAGSENATFTITLSRESNAPVNVDYATEDGTGDDAASAANGDYTKTDGTLTFSPGETSKKVEVPCFPNIDLRDPSDFDLVLTNPDGAMFPAAATTSANVEQPQTISLLDASAFPTEPTPVLAPLLDGPRSMSIRETINPNLRVGRVAKVKDFTTHGVGTLYVKRYDTLRIVKLYEGDWVYVGDELFVNSTSISAVEFSLGGAAVVAPGSTARVVDERHLQEESSGLLYILDQKIKIIVNVSHQQETVQIQTNAGVMGPKG